MNALGYHYLGQGDVETAIRVFELNVEMYPEAWNPHDSLGEAYVTADDRERAIANYQRSLDLNPGSESARDALTRLGVEAEATTVRCRTPCCRATSASTRSTRGSWWT